MTRRLVGILLTVSTVGVLFFTTPVSATETVTQGVTTVPVERLVAHWWVFPAAILFSTIALAAGVSGALFFTPFFLLVVGLTPAEAVGAGLLTELFGMSNGLRSYVKQDIVDYQTAKYLLAGAVPAVVVGAFAAHYIEPRLLKLAFGAGLVVLGGFLLYYDPPEDATPGGAESAFLERKNTGRGVTTIEATDGAQYSYETCWRPPGVALSTIGGFITGLISAGLPEIVTTQLIVRCRFPPRVAVATSVFVLAIAAAAGAAVHALTATPVWYVVAWSIPGVLVGGTVGTHVGKYLPSELMESGLGVVFGIVGLIVLAMEVMV